MWPLMYSSQCTSTQKLFCEIFGRKINAIILCRCTLPSYCHWLRVMVSTRTFSLMTRRSLVPAYTICISTSVDAYVCMHWWGCGMDVFQPVAAEHCKDRVSLVYNQPPSSSPATVATPGRIWSYRASFCGWRPRNIHWQWCLDEVL